MSTVDGQTMTFAEGDIIMREGDTDLRAYRVLSGWVQVYKTRRGRQIELARLGAGQFFGEMALVLETARTASVRALTDVTLGVVTQDAFNAMMLDDPRRAFPLVRLLFERLRQMNQRYLDALELLEGQGDEVSPTQLDPDERRLVLAGTSDRTKALLGVEGREIKELPFRIGRRITQTSDVLALNDLHVPDQPPYQVSRNHCAIDLTHDGELIVEDRGSTLGTLVNGVRIGSGTRRTAVKLDQAVNQLVLGAANSPVRFELRLEALSQD